MATEIKAIKCPQCGSPQKVEIKPGHYRCESCQTDYFLDEERLTIQHHHTFAPPAAAPAARLSPAARAVIGASVALAVVGVSLSNRHSAVAPTAYPAAAAQQEFYASVDKVVPLTGSAQQPLLLALTSRHYRAETDQAKNGTYVKFYDPVAQEELSTQRLETGPLNGSSADVDAREFSDGTLYVIVNKAVLYKVDRAGRHLVEVGQQLFQRQPALRAGVATVQFGYSSDGDGLTVITNDGKSLFYYPIVNRLYTEDELDKASEGLNTLLPGAAEKTYFSFTDPGIICKGATVKLLKITCKDNGGGPKNVCENITCSQKDMGYDDATHQTIYKNVDLDDSDRERYRISAFRDLTPGRPYFKPELLLADAQQVLIGTHPTAGELAPLSLQCLDAATGRVRWTTPLAKQDEIHYLVACKDGFVGTGYGPWGVLVDPNGKIIRHFQID